jgi:hypothetical protein
MEPGSMNASDHALFTSAMAIALVLVKVLEKCFDWVTKRVSGGKDGATKVELGDEPSRMIRETYEQSKHTDEIVSIRDNDGIPMVYTPRSSLENQLKMAEALRDMSKDTVSSSEELSRKIDEVLAEIKKTRV